MLIDVGDTRLHVTERGAGALALFVLHGGPGLDHTMFGSYLDPLGDVCRLLLVDERATGRSDQSPPETWTLAQHAADVEALAAAMGLERYAVLGHSYGALIALQHAVDFLLDTSDSLEDVRERYVYRLRELMDINEKLHAPPIVAFVWDQQVFKGVIESMDVAYTLFTPEGLPLRAQVSASLKEYRPVDVQVRETPKTSPDVEKSYVVRLGETLASIAAAVYRDPARWRDIAAANDIRDPRRLEPGTLLSLPALK